ncbi:MAG: acetylornithine transaminase [Propionibacteriaceae bacterium]|jgi:acetylornithine aminotransferase|nr:acetylornithine transaminase [Propionibacteriaceae bacterium]
MIDWMAKYGATLANTFGSPRRVLARGEGTHVWDVEGRCYTDFLSGIAVNVLGHCHAAVLGAVSAQLGTLDHVSNFFASVPQIQLAERLAGLVGATPVRVFLTNSGTEANEAGFKLARLTGRKRIVAMEGAFHGRTLGALALTWTAKYREPFEPLPGGVEFIPFGDFGALAAAVDETVAAVVVEPVQGENGVIPAPDGYLAAARAACDAAGALLWVDEVQTGLGRCGEWLVSVADGVIPDIVTLAKGLGNGFPVGACLAVGPAADLFTPGSHGTTFGGNPVAAAAALAVLDTLRDEGLVAAANAKGLRLSEAVLALGNPGIVGVRGRGLLRGIVLADPIAPAVNDALLARGWIANAPRPNVIRVAPPLIVAEDELVAFADALGEAVEEVRNAG